MYQNERVGHIWKVLREVKISIKLVLTFSLFCGIIVLLICGGTFMEERVDNIIEL